MFVKSAEQAYSGFNAVTIIYLDKQFSYRLQLQRSVSYVWIMECRIFGFRLFLSHQSRSSRSNAIASVSILLISYKTPVKTHCPYKLAGDFRCMYVLISFFVSLHINHYLIYLFIQSNYSYNGVYLNNDHGRDYC